MSYTLPHQLSAAELQLRQAALNQARQIYQFSETSGGLRAPSSLPESESFSTLVDTAGPTTVNFQSELNSGLAKFAANVLFHSFILTRNVANVRHDTTGDLEALEDQLADDPTMENIALYYDQLHSVVTSSGTSMKVEEYADLYQNWAKTTVKGLGSNLFSDEEFANQAVAGPCPTVIRKVSISDLNAYRNNGFPVTDDIFLANSPFTQNADTSLEIMAAEGRLYVEDFAIMSTINGANPGKNSDEKRFVFSPIALYAVTSDANPRLLPVAIQMRQNDRDPAHWDPIFVPHMPNAYVAGGSESNADWSWEVAKAGLSSASQNYHQMYEHLGWTHYFEEAIAMSTNRCLSTSHPVFALIKPHLLGTLAINDFARDTLVNDGGNLDIYIATAIEDFRDTAASSIFNTDFRAQFPATRLAQRDVGGLPYYPYRDDIVLLWDAIHAYVEQFLGIFYPTVSDFNNDMNVAMGGELGAWWQELTTTLTVGSSGAQVYGLNLGSLDGFDDLVELVTFIIHTASAQHAAVNFPQGDYYTNAAFSPATVSRPTPVPGSTNKKYYLEFLPPESQATIQLNQMAILGSIQFTELGRFEADAFSDSRVNTAISNFKSALTAIGVAIDSRNAALPSAKKYNYLHPKNIPQSTNI